MRITDAWRARGAASRAAHWGPSGATGRRAPLRGRLAFLSQGLKVWPRGEAWGVAYIPCAAREAAPRAVGTAFCFQVPYGVGTRLTEM